MITKVPKRIDLIAALPQGSVQLPVSELDAVLSRWETQSSEYRKRGGVSQNENLHYRAAGYFARADQLDECVQQIDKILAASATPRRVASGGS